jgi:soluble lytic murein transglycosylase-like protein
MLLVLILLAPCAGAFAGSYKYVDESGVMTLSDVPPPSTAKEVYAQTKESGSTKETKRGYYKDFYNYLIRNKAYEYDIDPTLVKAVIEVESNFDSRAVSSKGAMGLMQLMPATAEEMGAYNPFNPEDNIEAGVRYLKYLLDKFDGDLKLALAAYNAGPSRVKKYGAVPPIKETTSYVRKVFTLYKGGAYLPSSSHASSGVVKKKLKIYKIVLKDGTVLYTDSATYLKGPSSF